MEEILGAKLLSPSGETIEVADCVASNKTICLYFSAHWCPPCRGFTPMLSKAYSEYKARAGGGSEVELVFVSWDKSDDAFKEYHAEMPFPALPYEGTSELRQSLSKKFEVQGIPALVALNAQDGALLHADTDVDLRDLIAAHGGAAFPLSADRVAEMRLEEAAKAAASLRQLYDGSIQCSARSPAGQEATLNELLAQNDHVVLALGDGDTSDASYNVLKSACEAVRKDSKLGLLYVGWDLYSEECSHSDLASKLQAHSIPDPPEDLRAALQTIGGVRGAPTILVLRRGTGLCGKDGSCEEEGVPVLLTSDLGMQRVQEGGPAAFPWDDKAMEAAKARAKEIQEKRRAQQTNFEFFKSESRQDNLLVRTKGDATPTVAKDLVGLGEDGVVGLYFSAHWCPPCRGFTPKLIECYEELKAAGKKFEVVFISSDRDQESFEEYFGSMVTSKGDQWLALQYEQRDLKKELSSLFEVRGIPTLVLLKPDGTLITTDGREAVQYGSGYFPWDKASLDRAAAEADAVAQRKKDAALEKERDTVSRQQAAGVPVVKRLRGSPGCIEQNLEDKTLTFCEFATAGALDLLQTSGVLYYEVEVKTDSGIPQLGFALKDGMADMEDYSGCGVGDDGQSWGLDGSRKVKWHDGDEEWACKWSQGDIVGLAANIDSGEIAVSKNGKWSEQACGVVFKNDKIKQGVFPCFTAGDYQIRYALDEFRFGPPPQDVWGGSKGSESG